MVPISKISQIPTLPRFGPPPADMVEVLPLDQFALIKPNGCCETKVNSPRSGGVPLDETLKRIVYRKPGGFFIESGGQV